MSYEKHLRGLSHEDFVQVVNLCCTEGTRSEGEGRVYEGNMSRNGLRFRGRLTFWTYDIMGIPLMLEFYQGKEPGFRLSGMDWAVTFKTKYLIGQEVNDKTGFSARVGPLEKSSSLALTSTTRFFLTQFRRRGQLSRFLHDMCLIKLNL